MRLRDRLAGFDRQSGDELYESDVLSEWERAKDAGYDVGPEDHPVIVPALVGVVAALQRGAA
jgi:hypothetical protein